MLKFKIQFKNSIQDCDKVESNSSLFYLPVIKTLDKSYQYF